MKAQSTSIGRRLFMTVCLASVLPSALGLPVIGRSDTFENGTTQGWGGSYPGYTPYPCMCQRAGQQAPTMALWKSVQPGFTWPHATSRVRGQAIIFARA